MLFETGGSASVGLSDDLGRFKQLVMLQSTNRTMLTVGLEHSLAKGLLIEALTDQPRHIAASNVDIRNVGQGSHDSKLRLVDSH
jgi:hypothetical protein